ncbi:MAG: DUF1566 domain-containing protein [Epsilonproteobacteria bacterium]|nr:DUF1566 domain-containing protein [Campylobacterota bacterium]
MLRARYIVWVVLSLLTVFGTSGCVPSSQELQLKLKEHNIAKEVYIKNDTQGYDTYGTGKRALSTLFRAQSYSVIDIKEGYARLAALDGDLWVAVDALESEPTYLLRLSANVPSALIEIDGHPYEKGVRLPKGLYRIHASADGFLTQEFEVTLEADNEREILLEHDSTTQRDLDSEQETAQGLLERDEAEALRIAAEAEAAKIAADKEQKAKMAQRALKRANEMKKSLFIDKRQKLMWQDDEAAATIKRAWVTKANFDAKNFNDTQGESALSYCKNLRLLGYSDWRLPTKHELKSLYAQKGSLKNVSGSWYWSSSLTTSAPERAWCVYFKNGDGYSDLKNAHNHVRCVRILE